MTDDKYRILATEPWEPLADPKPCGCRWEREENGSLTHIYCSLEHFYEH